mmetsp:Transcript_12081/g.25182  ORF Transcript_12081/g.25182 Transcript_12081/m.25182 type:complete len:219 (-) Transcript_12081:8-664(-)
MAQRRQVQTQRAERRGRPKPRRRRKKLRPGGWRSQQLRATEGRRWHHTDRLNRQQMTMRRLPRRPSLPSSSARRTLAGIHPLRATPRLRCRLRACPLCIRRCSSPRKERTYRTRCRSKLCTSMKEGILRRQRFLSSALSPLCFTPRTPSCRSPRQWGVRWQLRSQRPCSPHSISLDAARSISGFWRTTGLALPHPRRGAPVGFSPRSGKRCGTTPSRS